MYFRSRDQAVQLQKESCMALFCLTPEDHSHSRSRVNTSQEEYNFLQVKQEEDGLLDSYHRLIAGFAISRKPSTLAIAGT